ncbi:MAG: family 78 glycoside hydrolase catalytic domain [Actinomycetota bacterium]|nr:family 78 glycoside hydrolase catalytic domain [Actinomycetota bacterium]
MASRRRARSRNRLSLLAALTMVVALVVPAIAADASPRRSRVSATDLRTEGATGPLGLDVDRPRFSWRLVGDGEGLVQTAYQVQVATSAALLDEGSADVWDSGRVDSSASAQVVYGGEELEPATRYVWRVRTWDGAGEESEWSEPAWWETGLLTDDAWAGASWIGRTFDHSPPSFADATISATVTVLSEALGVTFRADGDGNGYLWQLDDRGEAPLLRPHVQVDGEFTVLGEVPLADVLGSGLDQAHTLTISAVGDVITTSIDGVEVDVRTDATHAAGTFGFRAGRGERGRVDDVTVTEGDATVFSEDFGDANPFSAGELVDGALELGGDALLPGPHPPAPRFRHEFALDAPVASARLYLSGLGYSVAHLNGQRVGTEVLQPGQTDYSDTVPYTVADVTDLVAEGANAIGVELGRGFYGITTGNSWNWADAPWWSDPELRALLVVTHDDGSTSTITSDGSWLSSDDGPIRYDEVFVGETYDARMAQPGWATPGYDTSGWESAEVVDGPVGELRAEPHEPIRVTETVEPVAVTEPEPGVYVFDLGVQIAGWSQLTVEGPEGSEVSLRHGERLDEDGLVSIPSYGNFHSVPRAQTDVYVLAGDGVETWEPSFTYKGFRYVEVRGLPAPPEATTVVGRRVHNDVASIGHFASSSELLDRIRTNTRRALLNNHHHIVTDTPVYEKAGWTGDAQLTALTASYEFDTTRFHAKYLADVVDAQLESGELATIVPTPGWSYEGAPGWPAVQGPTPAWDAVLFVIPWNLYLAEGDVRVLEDHYPAMQQYFTWLESYAGDDGLFDVGLGDWVAPGGSPPEGPVLSSTAHAFRFASRLADVAAIVGDDEGAEVYAARAGELRDLFNEVFLDAEAGLYRTPEVEEYRQTSNILPLAFGLVPDDAVDDVVANLVADIEARDTHLNTGVVGTRDLLPVLSAHGRTDVAYALATQTTYPSWGFWFEELDRTSLPENWEEETRSLNHHFFGTIGQWLFADLAGIAPGAPGWATVRVKPHVPADLDRAEASTETVRGTVGSSWARTDGGFELDVEVPPNAVGEIHVPLLDGASADQVEAPDGAEVMGEEDGHAVFTVGSGTWRFTVPG